jgi:Sec-independent protein translocase protein TatA
MDFLGIGPLELFFILLIALIIFGPNDIVKAGKTLGTFLRKIVKSENWRIFQQASKGMRNLPNTLMREAGLEEEDLRALTGLSELEEATRDLNQGISSWTSPPQDKPAQPTIGSSSPYIDETPQPEETDNQPDSAPKDSPFSQTIDE